MKKKHNVGIDILRECYKKRLDGMMHSLEDLELNIEDRTLETSVFLQLRNQGLINIESTNKFISITDKGIIYIERVDNYAFKKRAQKYQNIIAVIAIIVAAANILVVMWLTMSRTIPNSKDKSLNTTKEIQKEAKKKAPTNTPIVDSVVFNSAIPVGDTLSE